MIKSKTESKIEPKMRAARAARAALYVEAEARRDAAVRQTGGAVDAPIPVAIVPRHVVRLRKTAARRHRAFEARLRELLHFVRHHGAEADARTLDAPAPLSATADRVVAAVCSACRGACCGNGGDHAFLRTRTLRDFVEAHPSLDDDGVVAAYRRHLPVFALHAGCVYQGSAGCTLPRAMRSAICNAYLCGGLRQALAEADGRTEVVFVARRDGDRLAGGQLRQLPMLDGGAHWPGDAAAGTIAP